MMLWERSLWVADLDEAQAPGTDRWHENWVLWGLIWHRFLVVPDLGTVPGICSVASVGYWRSGLSNCLPEGQQPSAYRAQDKSVSVYYRLLPISTHPIINDNKRVHKTHKKTNKQYTNTQNDIVTKTHKVGIKKRLFIVTITICHRVRKVTRNALGRGVYRGGATGTLAPAESDWLPPPPSLTDSKHVIS